MGVAFNGLPVGLPTRLARREALLRKIAAQQSQHVQGAKRFGRPSWNRTCAAQTEARFAKGSVQLARSPAWR